MGCFWSCEDPRARDVYIPSASRNIQARPSPCFGEYRCSSCGRYWNSRLSWPNQHQICKRCRTQVLPFNQRPLRDSDKSKDQETVQEHPKELCQMCQQLGRYCGTFGKQVYNEQPRVHSRGNHYRSKSNTKF